MNREQFAELIRNIAEITGLREVPVVGSQAILGSYNDSELPMAAIRSDELDVAIAGHRRAASVINLLGPRSLNYTHARVWVDVVAEKTANLPPGWKTRRVSFRSKGTDPGIAVSPSPHDLAACKLAVFRPQDREYVSALVESRIVDLDMLEKRAASIERLTPARRAEIDSWIRAERRGLGK